MPEFVPEFPLMQIVRRMRIHPAGLVTLLALCCAANVLALDRVRVETNVDAAIAKYGVSGKGVLVAIMDTGIDWTGNDFRNNNGATRIAAIYDLTDDYGAFQAGNKYGKGTIYTSSQINIALQGGPQLPTRDAVGRGTATAGIVAGNGRNIFAAKYRGIAPNVTLLIIKIYSPGAPAHDTQPAEAAFYDPSRIPIAIDFARDQAAALGMPCVMLLNLGSQNGPTDGTSSLSRKIDSTVGPNVPGLVFVTGTGEDGGIANRSAGVVAPNGAVSIQIQKISSSLTFDLWYSQFDRFDVSVTGPAGGGSYVSPAGDNQADIQNGPGFTYSHYGSAVTLFGGLNGKREIYIQLTGPSGFYTIMLRGRIVTSGRFDATINPSQIWNPAYSVNYLLNFATVGSIWDGATSFYNIAPNAYNLRESWTDLDGNPRSINSAVHGSVGQIWSGSSVGPTFDFRLGVDVSAPGEEVVTAYSAKSYWGTLRSNLIDDGHGLYGMAGGVAAASPIVAGIVALMLEMNPVLDANTVKSLLHKARTDAFTGPVPNTTWGYGKVDALRVLDAATQIVPINMTLSRTSLNFGTTAGGTLITSPQKVAIAFSAGPAVAWTASSSSSNIVVSPAQGTGNGSIQVSINGPGPAGTITVTAPGASNSPRQVAVNIATVAAGNPFGSFDTPSNNASGITGAIPVAGWALDNFEVASVGIWRERIGSEPIAPNGLVFIGNATLVAGARPDVETAFPNTPLNYRAGWGYMLLTNGLPNNSSTSPQPGNGSYKLHAIVTNTAGNTTDLGVHTITADNAHAIKPFGTLDTPEQGGTASGSSYVTFGWALTPNPGKIPEDGSTIFVTVDGVNLGGPVYGNYRPDIANAFPGYQNSGGAVGYLFLDTTKLTNGVHTIGWLVYDNLGRGDGIGSRFFTVLNAGGAAAPEEPIEAAAEVSLRRHVNRQSEPLEPERTGEYSIDLEPLGRIELQVGARTGFLIVDSERRELPLGSTRKGGVFYWQAPLGFLGDYDLLFQRVDGTELRARVRIH